MEPLVKTTRFGQVMVKQAETLITVWLPNDARDDRVRLTRAAKPRKSSDYLKAFAFAEGLGVYMDTVELMDAENPDLDYTVLMFLGSKVPA